MFRKAKRIQRRENSAARKEAGGRLLEGVDGWAAGGTLTPRPGGIIGGAGSDTAVQKVVPGSFGRVTGSTEVGFGEGQGVHDSFLSSEVPSKSRRLSAGEEIEESVSRLETGVGRGQEIRSTGEPPFLRDGQGSGRVGGTPADNKAMVEVVRHQYRFPIQVNGTRRLADLDSGACMSLTSRECVDSSMVIRPMSEIRLRGVWGNIKTAKECVELIFLVNNVKFSETCVVVDGLLNVDVILGAPFISKNSEFIDWDRNLFAGINGDGYSAVSLEEFEKLEH